MTGGIPEANIIALYSNDASLKEFLNRLLQGEGHNVVDCENEKSLFEHLNNSNIELLILDFESVNAIEICKKIRADFTLRYITTIILVEQTHAIEKIKGIYAGADDYAEKPIQAAELLIRIKANLWRTNRDLDANPLTRLPGNVSIFKEIERRIKEKSRICVGYADLNKFKEYNDYYGFGWGDKVIKHTASVISAALKKSGTTHDFLGHEGGDDFIFITDWDTIKNVCDHVIIEFDKTITTFYKEEDLNKGYIVVKNREGKITTSPILSISIGVVTNKTRTFLHVGQVIQLATELKSCAKTFSKSIYIIDPSKDDFSF